MIDWDKPIETLGGNPAKVISTDFRQACGAVFVAVQIEHDTFSFIGKYSQEGKPDYFSPAIRNRKTKRQGWINVYPLGVVSCAYEAKARAERNAGPNLVDTIKIEWEE